MGPKKHTEPINFNRYYDYWILFIFFIIFCIFQNRTVLTLLSEQKATKKKKQERNMYGDKISTIYQRVNLSIHMFKNYNKMHVMCTKEDTMILELTIYSH